MKGGRHISNSSPTDGHDLIISGGQASQEFGTQRGGDAANFGISNNIVNSMDFNALKQQFGLGGIRTADIDYNNVVNALDFNIIKVNFGLAGHTLICP